ncbi:MAG: hypothetical protein ACLPX1_02205 [Steroidobacteraceae bacterium]
MIADPLRSRWCGIALGLALCGCSGPVQDTATVNWRDLQVHVESRSYGPIPGMKELLVFVNRNGSLPAWDCRVELRTSDADPWKQAIEDGYVGVYRRAAKVDEGEHSVLQVRLSAEGSETVLHIPLMRNTQTGS